MDILAQIAAQEAAEAAAQYAHHVRACLTIIAVATSSIALGLWFFIIQWNLSRKKESLTDETTAHQEGG
jgi:hypothetical protein